MQQEANVTSQTTIAIVAAGSLLTPSISVSTRKVATCAPPPTPGSCAAEPTIVKASTSVAAVKFNALNSPPNA